MNDSFQAQIREATRLTQSGRLAEATQLIQRAMGLASATSGVSERFAGAVPKVEAVVYSTGVGGCVDGRVFVAPTVVPTVVPTVAPAQSPAVSPGFKETNFVSGDFVRGTQRHHYKLFTPPQTSGYGPLPLVVMLHGCSQNPDDFALGTGVNAAAQGDGQSPGFFVLYPSQPRNVNAQGCWHWFERAHQQRGRGEPAWIAELTQHIARNHAVDSQRSYIAGLSAGGAMAAVVAAAYPDVFAAVAVHSGLPVGAADNLTQALTAMKRGSSTAPTHPVTTVPTIVFHGDQDRTVHAVNGQALVAAATAGVICEVDKQTGASEFGKKFTRSVYSSAGKVCAEHWQLHGAGHAWSGGSAQGSYTDPRGIDATQAMLQFFNSQRLS